MIAKDFPCKTCKHAAVKHYSNISDGETVCTACSGARPLDYDEAHHEFVGDNLKYMELLVKKEEIRNES